MATCRYCDEEITNLRVSWSETVYYADYYDANGWEEDTGQVDSEGDGNYEWECPECGEILFREEDEACEFFHEEEVRQNPNSNIRVNNV